MSEYLFYALLGVGLVIFQVVAEAILDEWRDRRHNPDTVTVLLEKARKRLEADQE